MIFEGAVNLIHAATDVARSVLPHLRPVKLLFATACLSHSINILWSHPGERIEAVRQHHPPLPCMVRRQSLLSKQILILFASRLWQRWAEDRIKNTQKLSTQTTHSPECSDNQARMGMGIIAIRSLQRIFGRGKTENNRNVYNKHAHSIHHVFVHQWQLGYFYDIQRKVQHETIKPSAWSHPIKKLSQFRHQMSASCICDEPRLFRSSYCI